MDKEIRKYDRYVHNDFNNRKKNSASNKKSQRAFKGTPCAIAMQAPVEAKKTNSDSNKKQGTEHSIAMSQTLNLDSSIPANTDISSRKSQTASTTNRIRNARRIEKYIDGFCRVVGYGSLVSGQAYNVYANESGRGPGDIRNSINSDNSTAVSLKADARDATEELNPYKTAFILFTVAFLIYLFSLLNNWTIEKYIGRLEKNNHRPNDC